jgi:hypothetical protein
VFNVSRAFEQVGRCLINFSDQYRNAVRPTIYDKTYTIDRMKGVYSFFAEAIAHRPIRQSSLFTYHAERAQDFRTTNHANISLADIVITAQAKAEIAKHISFYGIDASTLFPDLDGLSRYLNWKFSNWESLQTVLKIGKFTASASP